jgi:hypothetical protein
MWPKNVEEMSSPMRKESLALILLVYLLNGCDAPVAAEQGKNHRVQPGESLFAIAERVYGNGLEWPRLWEANPWVNPDHLRAGEIIYIPAPDNTLAETPESAGGGLARTSDISQSRTRGARAGVRTSMDPGGGNPGVRMFHNLRRNVSNKTIFGFTLERAAMVIVMCYLFHALLQSVLVWLAAHITFVKEVSFKKSMKAVFLTETLTFTTIVVVGIVSVLVIYTTAEPLGDGAGPLFPTIEGYMHSPMGLALAGLLVMVLYVVLSLRFLPQVFGLPMNHAIALMALAILIPHLLGVYYVGQRMGFIQ